MQRSHLLYLKGVTEKEFIEIGPKIEEKWAFEVRVCISFRALLPENGILKNLPIGLASPKANFLGAMKIDMTCTTLGNMCKLNSDPCQVLLLLPAHS